jgi:hypothetical protein
MLCLSDIQFLLLICDSLAHYDPGYSLRLVEELFDIFWIAHIGLDCDRLSVGLTNLVDNLLCLVGLARIIQTTANPSEASRFAMLRPIPRDAPVTIAVLLIAFSVSSPAPLIEAVYDLRMRCFFI